MDKAAPAHSVVTPMKVISFKGPEELDEALFEVTKRKSTAKDRVTKSSFICDLLMSHPEIAKELRRIVNQKKRGK